MRTRLSRTNSPTKGYLALCWLACCFQLACGQNAFAQVTPTPSPSVTPIYWQQPMLFIPYQVNKNLPAAKDIAEVQLLVSRTGFDNWLVLQSANSNVQGFSYHAPEDGDYYFALKHLDVKKKPLDGTQILPQLHLVIDTKPPVLSLVAQEEGSNQIAIRYEATDANLNPQSLLIEGRSPGGLWTNVPLGPSEVAENQHLIGVARWSLPSTSSDIADATMEIRATVADSTGQRAHAQTTAFVRGAATITPPALPTSPLPGDSNIAAGETLVTSQKDPFQQTVRAAQDWPLNNQSTEARQPALNHSSGPPPILNPYVTAKEEPVSRRTPARFAVDGSEDVERGELENFAPDLLSGNNSVQSAPIALPSTEGTEWSSAAPANSQAKDAPLLVNARTFDVEYELASVGPGGVAKVQLWGTSDGGHTWQLFGTDPDNGSPARISVPTCGTFGFRIVVEGVNAPDAMPPQSGDNPELVVTVDLESPRAEIVAVEPGEANLADHLRIRWKADDDNLEARPVGLYYSSYPNGPWSTVAAGLENIGSYLWRIERHVPGRFYLKLEARDTAGNLTTYQTPEPVELNRQQPTGTIRGISPIGSMPNVGE